MISAETVYRRQEGLLEALERRRSDLDRYARTIGELHLTNVASDESYQRLFNGLYGVRRNKPWRSAYYNIFENRKRDTEISFRSVLLSIFEETGRVEASFASKLVATIDPTRAIYDSVVRTNLDLPTRIGKNLGRFEDLERDYNEIQRILSNEVKAPVFRFVRQCFHQKFPDLIHFTDIKILDLLIWQIR